MRKKVIVYLTVLTTLLSHTFAQDVHYASSLLVSKVKVISPMILEAMDSCCEAMIRCPFYQDKVPSQVEVVFDTKRSLYRFKICPQNNIESSIEYLMMKEYVSPDWTPYYCYYNEVNFFFMVEDSSLFEYQQSLEYVPYHPDAKFYAITTEKDSINYENKAYLSDDVCAYVYCKIINGQNHCYTISSRPCPDIVDMPILIDSPVKRVFLKIEE